MNRLRKLIEDTEILKSARPYSLDKLEVCGFSKKAVKGEHIFRDKDRVNTLYIVTGGLVSLYKNSSSGDKKVIFVYGKGNLVNEVIVNGLPASINCEAISDATLLCFPIDQFLAVMEEDFCLSKAVMDSMSIKIRRLYRQLKNTGSSIRIDKKIAAKLWKLSMDYGRPCGYGSKIELEMTITFLADMLGAKRETVSRQLKLLGDEGLVIFRDNRFIIPDPEKLKEYFKARD